MEGATNAEHMFGFPRELTQVVANLAEYLAEVFAADPWSGYSSTTSSKESRVPFVRGVDPNDRQAERRTARPGTCRVAQCSGQGACANEDSGRADQAIFHQGCVRAVVEKGMATVHVSVWGAKRKRLGALGVGGWRFSSRCDLYHCVRAESLASVGVPRDFWKLEVAEKSE